MRMAPRLRKLALTAHIVTSVGWIGAALAYAGLVLGALTSQDAHVVRAAYVAIQPMTWFAIVPLAAASLITGLVQSLGTPWGLFRHFWVLYKFLLTIIATLVLLGNTRTVSALAALALEHGGADASGLKGQLIHSLGGALVLLLAAVLAVYKPRGMTRYGWRKQHEERS
jgi:hypothetical protein